MGLIDVPPPQLHHQGHDLQSFRDLDGGHAKCLRCGWAVTMEESLDPGFQVPLCPESPEGKAAAQAEAQEEFTEAQSLGLVVASAMTQVTAQRDQAREMAAALEESLERALGALGDAIVAWPETSWAKDALGRERAQAVLDELRDPDAKP